MKNVIFMPKIVPTDEKLSKFGGWEWMDITRKSWEYWCKKNDVLFVPLEEPIETDLKRFRVNWQKAILVFDELDKRKIDYDQICLVDGAAIIKWDAPNFFELTDHKLTAWRDMDNLRWIKNSIDGYKNFFDSFELNSTIYISSGLIIFNESHKKVFNSFKEFYYKIVQLSLESENQMLVTLTQNLIVDVCVF